ncbi:MAG: 4-hydroxy-tetrahydrodipicolinate synthase [Lachnospiraceae bacterium]|nr:4-hydroxy-tetrahydrodipicolinate synthase [Lachnospiraceae bacterium]
MSLFIGSGVAIVTPFDENFKVNYDKLRELIDFQLANSTDAIIICGTTGEASVLTDEEQIDCIKFTVDYVNKRVPVIAGAGSNDTNHAIHLASESEAVGADGVLLVTPYYNKTTQKGLVAHYTKIANSINIPIILYNVPGRTGMSISPETCYELSKVKNIIGIKEASGNFGNIAKIAALCPDFDIYSGNDDQILPILSLGGKGVISVLANIAPKKVHDMVMNFFNGNIKESTRLQLEAICLIEALFVEVNPIPVKTSLNLMGYNVGKCKLPLVDMEEKNLKLLKKELKDYGLI